MELLAGRYRLGRPIARGGMAVVHRADDNVLQRPVAVKTLTPDRAGNTAYRSAVRREALTGARLMHPNIPRVLDYGEAEWYGLRLPFLVMELVAGRTLAAHLDEHGPDLSAVPSICESGIDAIRSGYDMATVNEATVAVVHPAPQVREQLHRHGLAELVDGTARS